MPAGVARVDPPQGSAVVLALMRGVDGCAGAYFDERRRLLHVWRMNYLIYTYDTDTGVLVDQPWPLDPAQVVLLGMSVAASLAIEERANAGHLPTPGARHL